MPDYFHKICYFVWVLFSRHQNAFVVTNKLITALTNALLVLQKYPRVSLPDATVMSTSVQETAGPC